MITTNRQFIKLTGAVFPITGSSIIIPVSNITSVSRFSDSPYTRVWDARLKPVGDDFWEVKETPEEIYAMLEPFDPSALKAGYEKLRHVASATRFKLAEICCRHIERGGIINAEALARDIDGACDQIKDIADKPL